MAIIKYKDSFDDLMEWMDRDWFFPQASYKRGYWYDPEKYELVPKDSYKKKLIEQKERELKLLDEKRKLLSEDVEKLKAG